MTDKDRDQVQAFSERMKNEGAAGFASGLTPWDSWDDFEDRVGSRVLQGSAEHVTEQEDSARSFGDRILTTMTALAVATLVIGVAGVFLTQHDTIQIADNQIQIPTIATNIHLTPQVMPAEETEHDIALNNPSTSVIETPVSPVAHNINNESAFEQPITLDDSPALPVMLTSNETPAAATDTPPVVEAPEDQTLSSDSDISSPEPDTDNQPVVVAINELPTPAAGIPATTVTEPAMGTAGNKARHSPDTKTTESDSSAPAQEIHLTRVSELDVHTELQQPAPPLEAVRDNGLSANNGGLWSINLASYLKSSTAENMKQKFLEQGVATDLVTASVRGKTYYRLRISGIETRDMALIQSETIKEQLGLQETWVTKQ